MCRNGPFFRLKDKNGEKKTFHCILIFPYVETWRFSGRLIFLFCTCCKKYVIQGESEVINFFFLPLLADLARWKKRVQKKKEIPSPAASLIARRLPWDDSDGRLSFALRAPYPCPWISFVSRLICMLSLMVVFGLLLSRTKPLIVRFNILQLKISPHCSEERMSRLWCALISRDAL